MNEPPKGKRFTYQSYAASLKSIHLPSATLSTSLDEDIADTSSHFHTAISSLRQLNLAPSFIKFADRVEGKSASLPLLLHHWKEIVEEWIAISTEAGKTNDGDGLKALLDLLQALLYDLRATILSLYLPILRTLVSFFELSLPSESLTALLSSLSLFFKMVLLPSLPDDVILQETWANVRSTFSSKVCGVEGRRILGEVCGSAFRRMKNEARDDVMVVMLKDMDENENVQVGIAWVVVAACKAPVHSLHISTPSFIRTLVEHHLNTSTPDSSLLLLRRILISLAHHTQSSAQYEVVSDIVTKRFIKEVNAFVSSIDDSAVSRVERSMSLLEIIVSVRKGSRMQQTQLSSILAVFPLLPHPLNPSLRSASFRLLMATLAASEMTLWLGAGRNALSWAWEDKLFGSELAGALADLDWGGWKSIMLPFIVRHVGDLLDTHALHTLTLLASLHETGRLDGIDDRLKGALTHWAVKRLGGWQRTDDAVLEFTLTLRLSSLLPLSQISSFLVRIVGEALTTSETQEDFEKGPMNAACILAESFNILSQAENVEGVDVGLWIMEGVKGWNWSSIVLDGLIKIGQARWAGSTSNLSFDIIFPYLSASILSHSRSLRLAALHVLCSPFIECTDVQRNAIRACVSAEEIPLEISGVRGRILKILKIAAVVGDDGETFGIVARWLLCQLKVNLRPLWEPTSQVLALLITRFPDEGYRILFEELQITATTNLQRVRTADLSPEEDAIQREAERTWRCPNVQKIDRVSRIWESGNSDAERVRLQKAQKVSERLDSFNYESLILRTFSECPAVPEKHNRSLIPFFLSLMNPTPLPRQRLSSYLTLFSKFSNPKALYMSSTLQELYLSCISFPDRSLQTLSLTCLLSYKSHHLAPFEDNLRSLLDDTKWRDELVLFDLSTIDSQDRPEVVGTLVRLLYGMLGERRGRGRGADKKSAILTALAVCTEGELGILVDLMLKPFGGLLRQSESETFSFRDVADTPLNQQVGYLTLLDDALRILGSRLLTYWPSLLGTTMDILHHAQKRLGILTLEGDEPVEEAVEDEDHAIEPTPGSSKLLRNVRQLGLKRFADFFRSSVGFDFIPYMHSAFASFISPRLTVLKTESIQAPSALLELFHTWTNARATCYFFMDFNVTVLPEVFGCLTATSVKPSVISKIYDIVERLLLFSSDDTRFTERIIHPNVASLLSHLSTFAGNSSSMKVTLGELFRRQTSLLSSLAPYITDGEQAVGLLHLLSPLLRKPVKIIPEKIKANLLSIMVNLFPQIPEMLDVGTASYSKAYNLLSSLFHSLRARQSRVVLVSAFEKLSSVNPSNNVLIELVASLNSYSSKRPEEPDFDRRLAAFEALNEKLYTTLSAQSWLPIIHNMLHFIQDPDELAVRSNAALALKRFVEMTAAANNVTTVDLFNNVMYPGLRNALRSKVELVRTEILGVVAYAIEKCETQPALQEMRPLLAAGDEEANFFNNIHHVQLHRRTRALRRLAERCVDGQIRSITLAEVFVPLVEHFIVGSSTLDHHLVNESISTMGHMARTLAWGPYNILVRKYIQLAQEKNSSERVYVRTVVAVLENFHFNMEETVVQAVDDDDDDDTDAVEMDRDALSKAQQISRIADAVNSRLLPTLLKYLEKRDETEDTIRISVSPGIVKVALHLPESLRRAQISQLITILSQIFRSKSQETRDVVRETLCKISASLGPTWLPQIIKELRTALLRGPHLHILAFVTHALLVQITSASTPETVPNLDDCVVDVAHISAEVIFGQSGKDLQSEEFRTKMREVRGSPSKGLDSFMILARHVTSPKLSVLLHPIRAIMYETETVKMMQKVDEVLGRITTGLNANKHFDPPNLLILCHTLISQNAKFLTEAPKLGKAKSKVKTEFVVQTKRDVPNETDHYAHNSSKLVAFGLDLLVTAFRRGQFDFHEADIISRLDPLVSLVEKSLHSNDAHVVALALKVSAAIIKCPLPALDSTLPELVQQTLEIIRQAGSGESELAQTAFRSLGTLIRDSAKVQVKEKDLTYLLEVIAADLEEADRQAAVFTLLRAIVSRKLVVPEIYDLMDKVSDVLVTSQSIQAQELCRSVLLQFLLDYPQGKGRLQKHMTFIVKNLSYVFESGRKSVMELLSAVFSKFNSDLLKEYNDLFFIGLVMVLTNDDSTKCREMAAELIKSLLHRSDADQRRALSTHLHSWIAQDTQPKLVSVAAQVYGILMDTLHQDSRPYVVNIRNDLKDRIERSADKLRELEEQPEDAEDVMEMDVDWQTAYQTHTTMAKILRIFPDSAAKFDQIPWTSIIDHTLFPHAWVRLAAARLVGILFTAVPVSKPSIEGPLSRSLLIDVARKSCLQLRSSVLDETLGLQIVKNLFYIGKCFCLSSADAVTQLSGRKRGLEEEEEESDDQEEEARDRPDVEDDPLPWLFSRLSYQVRSALIKRRNHFSGTANWSQEPASVLRWFAAMASHMDASLLERFLVHILTPLYRITDEETIRDSQIDELKTLAQELQELVQTKVGTTKFAGVYNRIRQGVLNVRRDRKKARVMQATIDPERAAKKKMHRNVLKKDNRKRKTKAFVAGKLTAAK